MSRYSWITVNGTKLSTVIDRHFGQPGSITCFPRASSPVKIDCRYEIQEPPATVSFNNLNAAEISHSAFSDVALINNGGTFIRTKSGVSCKIDMNDRLHCNA